MVRNQPEKRGPDAASRFRALFVKQREVTFVKTLDRGLAKVEKVVCIISLILMIAITFVNVASRCIFHFSFSFAEEITTGLFVLTSLMGSAIGVRKHVHLGLNVITDSLPAGTQRVLLLVSNLIGAVFCAYMTYLGIEMTLLEYRNGQITASLQWPEWVFGIVLPIGFAFIAIRFLMEAVWTLKHEEGGEYE